MTNPANIIPANILGHTVVHKQLVAHMDIINYSTTLQPVLLNRTLCIVKERLVIFMSEIMTGHSTCTIKRHSVAT